MKDAETVKKLLFEKKMIAGINIKIHQLNIKAADDSSENKRKKYLNSISKKTFQSEKFLDKYSNKLLVTHLPDDITKDRLIKHFPNHLELNLRHKPYPKCIITYSSAKEALDARVAADNQLDGKKIRVIMLPLQNDVQEKNDFSKNPNPLKKRKETPEGPLKVPAKKGRYYAKS